MATFTEIIRNISVEKFCDVFAASTRKAREVYLHRHDIRKPKASNRIKSIAGQGEVRARALFDKLQSREDDEMIEEVLRTWLLSKRELLVAALDHLGIEHENGLTESDDIDDRFQKLNESELSALSDKLLESHDKEEVSIYLGFMRIEKASQDEEDDDKEGDGEDDGKDSNPAQD